MKKRFIYILAAFFTTVLSCKKTEIDSSQNVVVTPIPNDTTNVPNDSTTYEVIVQVNVSGIKEVKGLMNFALYNSGSTFNDPEKAFREYFIPVDSKPNMSFLFDDIPAGEYALALFHDENSNYKLDQNFLGIPQEGFGFSNNAMGTFGPPSYSEAKFQVAENGKTTLNIQLRFF
jgi:uncharacterized protein (DUF2141 family)